MAPSRHHSHFINGQDSVSGQDRLQRLSPSTGQEVASYAAGSARDVDLAVEAARRALVSPAWRGLGGLQRSSLLLRVAQALDVERLAAVEAEETGKPPHHAREDVERSLDLWRYAAGALLAERGEAHTQLAPGLLGLVVAEPVGVVGLITPWNFPFLVASERLPFILAAGCTVVWKPSEFASGTALLAARMMTDAGLPPGVVNVVTGDGPGAGVPLVKHPGVAMVSFTGSSENGKRVMAQASDTLKRLSLELGGKNAILVLDDANLEQAADAVVEGFTHNAGQCCTATSRLLVQSRIAADLEAALAQRLARSNACFVQPATTGPQQRKVLGYLELGRKTARRVLSAPEHAGSTPPSIFVDLPQDSPLRNEEAFGPLLTMDVFSDDEDALRQANATPYGLAASVWTRDVTRGMALVHQLRAGRVWLNATQLNFPQLAIGGFGASGFGREAGSAGIRTYSELKTVLTRLGPP